MISESFYSCNGSACGCGGLCTHYRWAYVMATDVQKAFPGLGAWAVDGLLSLLAEVDQIQGEKIYVQWIPHHSSRFLLRLYYAVLHGQDDCYSSKSIWCVRVLRKVTLFSWIASLVLY